MRFVVKARALRAALACSAICLLVAGCTPRAEQAERFLANGERLLEAGDPVRAALEFQNALQLDPTLYRASFGLALVAEQRKEWRRMLHHLDRTITLSPSFWRAHLKRGQLLLAAGFADGAKQSAEAALAIAPNEAATLTLHASVLLRQGDAERARHFASEAAARDPGDIEPLLLLADERRQAGDQAAALGLIETALATKPNNLGLLLLRAAVQEEAGSSSDAAATYGTIAAAHPGHPAAARAIAEFSLRQGTPEAGERLLTDMLAAGGEQEETALALAGVIAAARGEPEALAALREYVARHPQASQSRIALADLYIAQGHSEEGERILHTLTDDRASQQDSLLGARLLAARLLERGAVAEAAQRVEQILARDPHHYEGQLLKALIALRQGEAATAVAELRQLLTSHPESAQAHLLAADAYRAQGVLELADRHFREAARLSDYAATFVLPYAEFLTGRGESERLQDLLQKASQRPGDDPGVLLAWAQLAERSGRREQALEIYEAMHQRWPESELIANNLANLLLEQLADSDGVDDVQTVAGELRQRAYALASPLSSSDLPHFQDTAGWASYHVGRYKDAVALIGRAVEAAPDQAVFRYHLGMALLASGDAEAAREHLTLARAAQPSSAIPVESVEQALAEAGSPALQ